MGLMVLLMAGGGLSLAGTAFDDGWTREKKMEMESETEEEK